MGLNLKNAEVERLAKEVGALALESKTEAIRIALLERKVRLRARAGRRSPQKNVFRYLEQNVWPLMPAPEVGRVLSREEEDQILGYGPDGA